MNERLNLVSMGRKMNTILKKFTDFCECERASAFSEYALISALSCGAIIVAMDGLKLDIVEAFRNIGKRMVEATKFPPL
jgi:Flp pilus assembly pilin Flp